MSETGAKVIAGLLVDSTGSMVTIRDKAVSGTREYIEELRSSLPGATVLIGTFNSCAGMAVLRRGAAKTIEPIGPDEYEPTCMTPLYDAMMAFMAELEDEANRLGAEQVFFVTMTDGYENASSGFTRDDVGEKIETLRDKGWEGIFLGAGIDAVAVGKSIGTSPGSTLTTNTADWTAETRAVASLTASAALDEDYETGTFFQQGASSEAG